MKLKDYEKKVIEILVSNKLSPEALANVIQNAEFVSYQYTGSGYFLTIRHSDLPENRVVCDRPFPVGKAENIQCGFIVFLKNNELTIECHQWGELEIPEDFREKNIELGVY